MKSMVVTTWFIISVAMFLGESAEQANAQSNPQCTQSMPQGLETYQCSCAPDQGSTAPFWGNGPYTADSDLCSAARHAGIVGEHGGAIKVLRLQGLHSYWGSSSNGWTSQSWDSYSSSITFNRN
jgi:hypothetical protein|mmetsp:Transcript_15254/g.22343  ORF Transcript_15254/g.22343 Transcript_15254/m.22343 type:complete len:124 (-) Transcript_15254:18-389(-)